LLPFFIFAIWLSIKNYKKIKVSAQKLVHPANQKIILAGFSIKKHLLKTIFLCTALISIFFALLQPQWGKKEINVAQEGRDLLIALDISRSMLAKDLKPSRLEFTKLKIRKLLQKLDFERVGLILFSGSAFLQCPLTADHAAFLMFLDQVDVETIASGTTAIDSAISKSISVFEQSKDRKNKLVLLASDGEDFSLNLQGVKTKAAENEIKVFALGVGTLQGAPIPKFDRNGKPAGHETDEKGEIAISALNEKILEELSQNLGGDYFKITYDDSDLNQFLKKIKSFEKEKFEDKKISYYQDQYPWLLALAFIMLLLEWIL
jgi:Ca-activated chloride channel family protein